MFTERAPILRTVATLVTVNSDLRDKTVMYMQVRLINVVFSCPNHLTYTVKFEVSRKGATFPISLTFNSTTVIEKIKDMPRSLFYDIQCYVTMD